MNKKEFEKAWSETGTGLKKVFFGNTSFIYGDGYYFDIDHPNRARISKGGLLSGVISLSRIKRIKD